MALSYPFLYSKHLAQCLAYHRLQVNIWWMHELSCEIVVINEINNWHEVFGIWEAFTTWLLLILSWTWSLLRLVIVFRGLRLFVVFSARPRHMVPQATNYNFMITAAGKKPQAENKVDELSSLLERVALCVHTVILWAQWPFNMYYFIMKERLTNSLHLLSISYVVGPVFVLFITYFLLPLQQPYEEFAITILDRHTG